MRMVAVLSSALFLLSGCASELADDSASYSPQTNLYWQRCAVGSSWDGVGCIGAAEELDWDGAVDACAALGPGYRLPTLDEMALLLGECSEGGAARCAPCEASGECSSVLADPDGFGWTWTADRTVDTSDGAFVVDLRDGVIAFDGAERGFYARCVTETP